MLCMSQGDVAPTPSLAKEEAVTASDEFMFKFGPSGLFRVHTTTVQYLLGLRTGGGPDV